MIVSHLTRCRGCLSEASLTARFECLWDYTHLMRSLNEPRRAEQLATLLKDCAECCCDYIFPMWLSRRFSSARFWSAGDIANAGGSTWQRPAHQSVPVLRGFESRPCQHHGNLSPTFVAMRPFAKQAANADGTPSWLERSLLREAQGSKPGGLATAHSSARNRLIDPRCRHFSDASILRPARRSQSSDSPTLNATFRS